MSLDLVSAKNQKQIDGTQKIYSLDEELHENILSVAQPRKSFPVIHKMQDYYADSVFLLGELKALKLEISKIKNQITNKTALTGLEKFIDIAIDDENNIYLTAD